MGYHGTLDSSMRFLAVQQLNASRASEREAVKAVVCSCHFEEIDGIRFRVLSPSCEDHCQLTHYVPKVPSIARDRRRDQKRGTEHSIKEG